MRALACLLFALSLASSGCGAKVVVDMGTAAGTPGTLTCDEVCLKTVAACPTNMPKNCMTGCVTTDKIGNAACPDAYQAFLTCADAHPASQCDGSNACNAEVTAFSNCLTKVCSTDPAKCQP